MPAAKLDLYKKHTADYVTPKKPVLLKVKSAQYLAIAGKGAPGARVGAGSDVRFDTMGVVVWSHRLDPTAYDTGVFFSDIDERQRSVLRAFVVSHGDEPQPA